MGEHITQKAMPLFVGDSLALDFINTEYGSGPSHRDVFAGDRDVVDWLRKVGILAGEPESLSRGLASLARKLRASARELLEAGKAGTWADPAVVNSVLERGQRPDELRWHARARKFQRAKRTARLDAPGLLVPVAEDLAHLLAEADLDLVRQCEGENCTLLFRDVTKSRRRRWCSMAGCGNRMKVAAFRARQRAG